MNLVSVLTLSFANFLQLFTHKSFLLPVLNSGRFLKVLPPLVFPDDTFFFNHALETLDGLFKRFIFTYTNVGDLESPPFAY